MKRKISRRRCLEMITFTTKTPSQKSQSSLKEWSLRRSLLSTMRRRQNWEKSISELVRSIQASIHLKESQSIRMKDTRKSGRNGSQLMRSNTIHKCILKIEMKRGFSIFKLTLATYTLNLVDKILMEPNPEPQEEVKTVEGPSEIPEGHSVKYYEWTDDMTQKCQDVIDEDENYHPEAGKLKKHAGMNWHIFYSNNKTNFFKNRHYLIKEFTEMKEKCDDQEIVRLLDAGCGVGNALFPLCKDLPNLHVDAFDFALKAVNLVKEHEKFEEERMKVEQ